MSRKISKLEKSLSTEAKEAIKRALFCCGNQLRGTLSKATDHDFIIYPPDEIPFAGILEKVGFLKSGKLYDYTQDKTQKDKKVYYITRKGINASEERDWN